MSEYALALAFVAAAFGYLHMTFGDVLHYQSPLLVGAALCAPAAALGAVSWLLRPGFVRSWHVVACTALGVLGAFYAAEPDNHRGMVAAGYLLLTPPIAALVAERRCWWRCAKIYVLASAAALAWALWYEYGGLSLEALTAFHRFGYLTTKHGFRLANPNVVGGQLAFAAVLAFVLHLRGAAAGRPAPDATEPSPAPRPAAFSLAWTVFLAAGCLLTASRGAFAALLGGLGVLMLGGTRNLGLQRTKDLLALGGLLMVAMLLMALATSFSPWQNLQARFDSPEEVVTASGRTLLWLDAFRTWWDNPRYLLLGTGTGAAPEALGRTLGLPIPDGSTTAAQDSHNAMVEWGLSLGLAGMVPGICLLGALWQRAKRLDRRECSVNRRAILVCFCLVSMNYVTYYQLFFVAAGALVLAMVCEPAAACAAPKPAWRTAASGATAPAYRVSGMAAQGGGR